MHVIAILETVPIRLPIEFSLLSHTKIVWLNGCAGLQNVPPARRLLSYFQMSAADNVAGSPSGQNRTEMSHGRMTHVTVPKVSRTEVISMGASAPMNPGENRWTVSASLAGVGSFGDGAAAVLSSGSAVYLASARAGGIAWRRGIGFGTGRDRGDSGGEPCEA
jgi:hypothetical protein